MTDDAGMTVPTGGRHRRRPDSPMGSDVAPAQPAAVSAAATADHRYAAEPPVAASVPPADGEALGASGAAAVAVTPGGPAGKQRKQLSFAQELPLLVALAIVLAILIKTFAF